MDVIRLKKELRKTFEMLRFYQEHKPDQELQIAYLTMKSKYLIEQINSVNITEKIFSRISD